jgi:hypothetical protein
MAKVIKKNETTGVDEVVETADEVVETAETAEFKPVIDENLVVAVVKTRYSIVGEDGRKITFEPGNVTMPREHAEHWYAAAQGTQIIGVPDNGSMSGVGAKAKIKKMLDEAVNLNAELVAFEALHDGIDDEQRANLVSAAKFADGIAKLIGKL